MSTLWIPDGEVWWIALQALPGLIRGALTTADGCEIGTEAYGLDVGAVIYIYICINIHFFELLSEGLGVQGRVMACIYLCIHMHHIPLDSKNMCIYIYDMNHVCSC